MVLAEECFYFTVDLLTSDAFLLCIFCHLHDTKVLWLLPRAAWILCALITVYNSCPTT